MNVAGAMSAWEVHQKSLVYPELTFITDRVKLGFGNEDCTLYRRQKDRIWNMGW